MPKQIGLPDGSIGQFPDDMPDMEIEAVLAKQFGGAKDPTPMSWGDALKSGAVNIPTSGMRLVSDLWKSVTSPIETAKAIGNTALGYGQMAVGADGEERKLAEGMNAYFKDRYGSEDGFKQAVATDPAGVMADISTVFTGVGGALKGGATVAAKVGATGRALEAAQIAGNAAARVGAVTDPLAAAGKLASVTVAPAARGVGSLITGGQPLAEKLYSAAIKPSTTLSPAERSAVIQTGIAERLLPNQGGMDRMRGLMGMTGDQVDAIIKNSPAQIDSVDVGLNAGNQIRGGVHSNTVAPTAAQQASGAVMRDFMDNYGHGEIPIQQAQRLKQNTYKAIADAYGELSGPDKEARKALAKSLKDEIAKAEPDVAVLNERLGKLMELQPELERALSRTQNHNFIGLGAMLGGAGAIGGGAGLLGMPLLVAGGAKIASEPVNVARAAFAVDALNKARAKVGGLLDRVPLTRRQMTYPAYVDRMREE